MTKLLYFPRRKRADGEGPWWLEVAVVARPTDDPQTGGQVLAQFEMTVDALEYAIHLTTVGRNTVQVIYDDMGEVGAIMAHVKGQPAYAGVVKGKLEIELSSAENSPAAIAVRPCHAPGEPTA